MRNILPLAVILTLCTIPGGFAEETTRPTPPVAPTGPVAPAEPVVPGAARTDAGTERRWLPPVLPPRPARPEGTGENTEPVREIETYGLTVVSALAEGDARRNMARTITDARYTVYSNNTTALRLEFRDGSPYVYHFSRPHGSIEIRTGVFRETCGVTVQVGKMLLLETYTAEIYRDERGIMQADILGNGRIIVRFDVARKP